MVARLLGLVKDLDNVLQTDERSVLEQGQHFLNDRLLRDERIVLARRTDFI